MQHSESSPKRSCTLPRQAACASGGLGSYQLRDSLSRIGLRLVACNRESPRRQLGLIHRLRMQVEGGARLCVAKQTLNRFYVFAFVDKKSREAVAEVVEAEPLTNLQLDANLSRGGANFILRHHAGA
jgi:hypothetical protein